MRLNYKTAVLFCAVLFSSLTASASESYYPVAGEYSTAYKAVFEKISKGECGNMQDELKALEEKAGISSNIYLALCFFGKGDADSGGKAVSQMLNDEEYDEALYVLNSAEEKNGQSPEIYKLKGKALYGTGRLDESLAAFMKYRESGGDDPETDYFISDIYANMGDTAKSEAELEAVAGKDQRYSYRMAVLDLKKGKTQSALKNFRSITKEPYEDLFMKSRSFIGEICASRQRFYCAEKAYAEMGGTPYAIQKNNELESRKKLFSAFIAIGEQYDTNVTAVDEDKVENVSEEDSFRTYVAADLKLSFYRLLYDRIDAGILNYMSWNHSVSEYDARSHKLYAGFIKRYDNFELTLPKLSYTFMYLDGEDYYTSFKAEAEAAYLMDGWRFYVPVAYTTKDYDTEVPDEYDRDGDTVEAGAGVSRSFLNKYFARLEYRYGYEDTDGELKELSRNELQAAFAASLTKKLNLQLEYDVTFYDYDSSDREDTYHSASATLLYNWMKNHYIAVGYSYNRNESNDDVNDYDKHVIDMSMHYTY